MMKLFCENSYRFKLHEDVGTTQCVYRDRFWQDSKHDFEKRNYLEKFGEKLVFLFFWFAMQLPQSHIWPTGKEAATRC